MANEKITLTLHDLNSPQVEGRLRQQEAVAAAQAKFNEQSPSPLDTRRRRDSGSLWFSTVFNMAFFGLLGGLLAWGCGEMRYYFYPDQLAQAQELLRESKSAHQAAGMSPGTLRAVLEQIDELGRQNDYWKALTEEGLSPQERDLALSRVKLRELIANMLYYGACGMMIAMALAMADPLSSRNYRGAVTNGAVGAVLGLIGGVMVSLLVHYLYSALGGQRLDEEVPLSRQMLANVVKWGVLGLFLSLAPGVVMKNPKKLVVGLIGGLIGGVLGGALFDPVAQLTRGWHFGDKYTAARLVAMVAIGLIAGASTGLIENAAKAGWMKVVSGLIAGKQFILYRDPTFIGSAPQCQIYLFKDPKIGRRHAAIHITPGGYYLEDLGSGAQTLVNGRAVARVRLKHGDQVQVGATTFAFREKEKAKH